MKQTLKYAASIFFSLLILTVSSGFTFSRMVCLESGYTLYALEEQGDCCDKRNLPPVRIEKPCCDIVNQNVGVDDYAPSFTKTVKPHFALAAVVVSDIKISETYFSKIFPQYISSLPPPLGGIDFLHSIHKLTV